MPMVRMRLIGSRDDADTVINALHGIDGIEQQRGQYLSELQPRWQQWNCDVAPDGTIRESGELDALAGQDDSTTIPVEAPTR